MQVGGAALPATPKPRSTAGRAGKNIVICADGTGNTTIKGRGTNVFKAYEAVDQSGHRIDRQLQPQVALYHDGVGTENIKWWRIVSGATGWGLSRNVKQLYEELARVYAPGDRIFMFGFSRGAFTVRTLAGFIALCGIPDLSKHATNAALKRAVNEAYREYRRKYASWLSRLFARPRVYDAAAVQELRRRYSVHIPQFEPDYEGGRLIAFLGVWDTVDAVGLPFRVAQFWNRFIYAFKFPDRTLSEHVGSAWHALALDEERESFEPVLWDEAHTSDPGRIHQVWFAGVHSNVGGGYPRQGMSLVALDWMMKGAERQGLRFIAHERASYSCHADVDDKAYDSRGGLGMFYRWKPRNVRALCEANGIAPKLHRSVFERIARSTEGYAPGWVPARCEVVSSTAPEPMLRAIERTVASHHRSAHALVERTDAWLTLGRWAYWLSVWSVLVAAGFIVSGFIADAATAAAPGDGHWINVVRHVASSVFSSRWISLTLRTAWRHPWLPVWFAATVLAGLRIDARLDRAYSEFWHDVRLSLRNSMGLGRSRTGPAEAGHDER